MEPIEFKQMVLRFSQVSYVLSASERVAALKISFAIKKFLQRKALRTLAAFPHEPCMMLYIADGWGATVFNTLKAAIPGSHLVITRKGRYRHEFLLQRGLLRISLVTGNTLLLPLLEDPIGRVHGLGAWHAFNVVCIVVYSSPRCGT